MLDPMNENKLLYGSLPVLPAIRILHISRQSKARTVPRQVDTQPWREQQRYPKSGKPTSQRSTTLSPSSLHETLLRTTTTLSYHIGRKRHNDCAIEWINPMMDDQLTDSRRVKRRRKPPPDAQLRRFFIALGPVWWWSGFAQARKWLPRLVERSVGRSE